MARSCTVCKHPKRDEINALLLEGVESRRSISRRFGLTTTAMHRHVHGHLKVGTTAEDGDVAPVGSVGSVDQQQRADEARRIREQAMKAGDPRLALQALKMEAALETEARKAGAGQRAVGSDLATSTEWAAIRNAFVDAAFCPDCKPKIVAICLEVDAAE